MGRTSPWSVPIRKANYLGDPAADDAFGNAGMDHSISAQRCIERAAPAIFGALQRGCIGGEHRVSGVLLGEFASQVVMPKILTDSDHRVFLPLSQFCHDRTSIESIERRLAGEFCPAAHGSIRKQSLACSPRRD